MWFVALLPPADLQLFWRLSSPHRLLTSDVLTLPLSEWSNTSDGRLIDPRTWTFLPYLETRSFVWANHVCLKRQREGWKQRPCTFRLRAQSGSQIGLSTFEADLWLPHLGLPPGYGCKEHWPMWIKSGASGIYKTLKRGLLSLSVWIL